MKFNLGYLRNKFAYIETIAERRDYSMNILTLNCLHGTAPLALTGKATYIDEYHSCNERLSSNKMLVELQMYYLILKMSWPKNPLFNKLLTYGINCLVT